MARVWSGSSRRATLVSGALLAFVSVAYAGLAIEATGLLGTRPIEDVVDGDGNESADVSVPLSERVQTTEGNPTIAVTASFSAAGASCVVTVLNLDSSGAIVGLQQATASASRFRTSAAGDYLAQTLFFDVLACPKYSVRHDDPTSGTVSLRPWCIGAEPQ